MSLPSCLSIEGFLMTRLRQRLQARMVWTCMGLLGLVLLTTGCKKKYAKAQQPQGVASHNTNVQKVKGPTLDSLFYIARNKNRNQVHFGIRLTKNCLPKGKYPLYNYWLMLEQGPKRRAKVGFFERLAYGIASQKVKGQIVQVKLKALAARTIEIVVRREGKRCVARAYTQILKKKSLLLSIYAFALKAFPMPKVKYIDVFGQSLSGKLLQERIQKK